MPANSPSGHAAHGGPPGRRGHAGDGGDAGDAAYDIVLLGTGLAPLWAAAYLGARGKRVCLLNPQGDFFLENSELSLDPLVSPTMEAIARASPERALEILRPNFPGAVELWTGSGRDPSGFHDEAAPHIRARGRLIVGSRAVLPEDLYLQASDAGLNPQLWEGAQALRRLPGAAPRPVPAAHAGLQAIHLPRSCDVDVSRYRNGLLEFVRERLPPDDLVTDVSQLELVDGGVRFHAQGVARFAALREGMIAFWTPALTSWVQAVQAQSKVKAAATPRGVRLWEQWSLVSREKPDPSLIAMLEDLTVWAEIEGAPDREPRPGRPVPNRLSCLSRGPLLALGRFQSPDLGLSWASEDSFQKVSRLCTEYLGWQEISIQKLTSRALLEWDARKPASWEWAAAPWPRLLVQGRADGPVVEVVDSARVACEALLGAADDVESAESRADGEGGAGKGGAA